MKDNEEMTITGKYIEGSMQNKGDPTCEIKNNICVMHNSMRTMILEQDDEIGRYHTTNSFLGTRYKQSSKRMQAGPGKSRPRHAASSLDASRCSPIRGLGMLFPRAHVPLQFALFSDLNVARIFHYCVQNIWATYWLHMGSPYAAHMQPICGPYVECFQKQPNCMWPICCLTYGNI